MASGMCKHGNMVTTSYCALCMEERANDSLLDNYQDKISTLNTRLSLAIAALKRIAELSMLDHYECEDPWYSCPKSEGGCVNESIGNECNCGADKHNETIAAIVAGALKEVGE